MFFLPSFLGNQKVSSFNRDCWYISPFPSLEPETEDMSIRVTQHGWSPSILKPRDADGHGRGWGQG